MRPSRILASIAGRGSFIVPLPDQILISCSSKVVIVECFMRRRRHCIQYMVWQGISGGSPQFGRSTPTCCAWGGEDRLRKACAHVPYQPAVPSFLLLLRTQHSSRRRTRCHAMYTRGLPAVARISVAVAVSATAAASAPHDDFEQCKF